MSRGAPDWTHVNIVDVVAQSLESIRVDVYAQTPPEIVQRNRNGAAHTALLNILITDPDYTTIMEVLGTGVIYGGWWSLTGEGHTGTGYVELYLDGELIVEFTIDNLNNFDVNCHDAAPIYIKKHDETNDWYIMIFSQGITFEDSILLRYFNTAEEDVNSVGYLYYATI